MEMDIKRVVSILSMAFIFFVIFLSVLNVYAGRVEKRNAAIGNSFEKSFNSYSDTPGSTEAPATP